MVSNCKGMSDFEAAGIVDRAFPKHPLFWKTDTYISVVDLMDALFIAKKGVRVIGLATVLSGAERLFIRRSKYERVPI